MWREGKRERKGRGGRKKEVEIGERKREEKERRLEGKEEHEEEK